VCATETTLSPAAIVSSYHYHYKILTVSNYDIIRCHLESGLPHLNASMLPDYHLAFNALIPSSRCVFGVIVCANAEGPKSALANIDSANTAERRTLALNIVFFIIS
jgi:hypothetical protein